MARCLVFNLNEKHTLITITRHRWWNIPYRFSFSSQSALEEEKQADFFFLDKNRIRVCVKTIKTGCELITCFMCVCVWLWYRKENIVFGFNMMIGIYASLKKLDQKGKSKSISEMSKERYSCKKKENKLMIVTFFRTFVKRRRKKFFDWRHNGIYNVIKCFFSSSSSSLFWIIIRWDLRLSRLPCLFFF